MPDYFRRVETEDEKKLRAVALKKKQAEEGRFFDAGAILKGAGDVLGGVADAMGKTPLGFFPGAPTVGQTLDAADTGYSAAGEAGLRVLEKRDPFASPKTTYGPGYTGPRPEQKEPDPLERVQGMAESFRKRPGTEQAFVDLAFTAPVGEAVQGVRAGAQALAKGKTATAPLRSAPTGAAIAIPQNAPSEVSRSLQQATEIVRQDTPGALSRVADKVPGLKQARRMERPGLELPEHILTSYVAEGATQSEFAQRAFASRQQALSAIDAAFGKGAAAGGKTAAAFKGTPQQAQSPLTGTFRDIAENPELYTLTPEQQAVIAQLQKHNDDLLAYVKGGYGADIGEFPAKPGGAFLADPDISEEALQRFSGNTSRAVSSGRSKTRVYPTARDRMAADPDFEPQTNVRSLLEGMDASKGYAAGGQTFRTGVGGLTRTEVLQKTHPALAAKMDGLKAKLQSLRGGVERLDAKQAGAIDDFMASPQNPQDVNDLLAALNPRIGANAVGVQGVNFGKDVAALKTAIGTVKAELARLRPMWEAANPKGYEFVQEGLYRYFPTEEAAMLRELRKTSNSGVIQFLDNYRATVLGGDLSPITGVQAPIGFLFDPVGTVKQWAGGAKSMADAGDILRPFRADALADDVAKNAQSWQDFAYYTGRPAIFKTPEEFGTGFIGKVPKVGAKYNALNEAMFIGVQRMQKRLFDDITEMLVKSGTPREEALAAAGDQVTKAYPLINPRRLGQSQSRAANLRAGFTSVSFLRKPAELVADAANGIAKTIARKPLSSKERVAVRLVLTLTASTEMAAITSNVLSALANDRDPMQAVGESLDPNHPKFMAIVVGDRYVPIGGPFRSLFRALWPRQVGDFPVPIPGAGLYDFLTNRVTPALRTQIDLMTNRDFQGNTIRKGDFPADIFRVLAYELEGASPITAGEVQEAVRTGQSPEDAAIDIGGQFLGGNPQQLSLTRLWQQAGYSKEEAEAYIRKVQGKMASITELENRAKKANAYTPKLRADIAKARKQLEASLRNPKPKRTSGFFSAAPKNPAQQPTPRPSFFAPATAR